MTNSKDKHDQVIASVNTIAECYLDSTYRRILTSCKGNRKKADKIIECLSLFNTYREDIQQALIDSIWDI